MDIFMIFSLFGGIALFLFGMNFMGSGLERVSGGHLEKILEKLSGNTIKGVLLGTGVTAIIQSSAATTVMVVGFVNSGIMKLNQAIGIIMGANIGTTATAWILSLTGLKGDNIAVRLLKPESFSNVIAVIGILLFLFFTSGKKKDVGSICLGFAILMFGMSSMIKAVSPLADVPAFQNLFLMFTNPILGVLVGAIVTAIVQSSSATVGILQAISATGALKFGAALPIIMGQNIGTCVTALISSIGANKNAKRAAMVHLYFNLIGTVLFLIVFYTLNAIMHFTFIDSTVTTFNVAIIHTIFNVLTTLVMLPLSKQLGKLAEITIRDKSEVVTSTMLDERFINTPSFAVEKCYGVTKEMAVLTREILEKAITLVDKYTDMIAEEVIEGESKIDTYEDNLGTYLVKLSSKSLSMNDSHEISKLLHVIGDLERISDHAVNIVEVAQEMKSKGVVFSEGAKNELRVMGKALCEILDITITSFCENDLILAEKVEPLEEVIDGLNEELRARHIDRLQNGECTIQLGFIFSDLITNYERVSDHCSNIAVCMIRVAQNTLNVHEYLQDVKKSGQKKFIDDYEEYKNKYALSDSNYSGK